MHAYEAEKMDLKVENEKLKVDCLILKRGAVLADEMHCDGGLVREQVRPYLSLLVPTCLFSQF